MLFSPPATMGYLLYIVFLTKSGLSLLIAVSGSLVFLAGLYHLLEIPRQQIHKRQWLRSNADAIRGHLIVQYCLTRWKEKRGFCNKCGSHRLDLWDHHGDLLVLRCSSCRINYTLTAHSGPMIAQILQYMPSEYVLVSGLRENRHELLGRHLSRSCGPCSTFVENKLSES